MAPEVDLGKDGKVHVDRAIVGPQNTHLYVGGAPGAVAAVTFAERVEGVALEEGETPEALTKGMEPVEEVVFSKDKPPVTVYTLEAEPGLL